MYYLTLVYDTVTTKHPVHTLAHSLGAVHSAQWEAALAFISLTNGTAYVGNSGQVWLVILIFKDLNLMLQC